MEHLRHLTYKDIEISEILGGADEPLYEQEKYEPSNNAHYAFETGHERRSLADKELYKKLLTVGLVGIGVMIAGCAPPIDTESAYYNPFTKKITYLNGSEKDPKVVSHETYHKDVQFAGEDRWVTIFRYETDPIYRCQIEYDANVYAGYEDPMVHPYCTGIELPKK